MRRVPRHGGARSTKRFRQKLEADARKVRRELERFKAIAEGRAPASVLAEIKRREARLGEIEQERQTLTD